MFRQNATQARQPERRSRLEVFYLPFRDVISFNLFGDYRNTLFALNVYHYLVYVARLYVDYRPPFSLLSTEVMLFAF